MKIFFYLFLLLFIFSCSNNIKTKVNEPTRVKIIFPDFLTNNLDSILTLSTNFKIDSLFFNDSIRLSKRKLIDLKIVDSLSINLSKDELTENNNYYLNAYFEIQRSKLKGTYDEYVKNLDIGMTLNSDSYYIGKILYPDSIAVILWELSYSSYEACPFYSGSHVLASLIYKGKIVQTLQIAGHVINADPPIDLESFDLCKFDRNGTFVRKNIFNVNEENESIEKGSKIDKFKITKFGFKKFRNNTK